MGYWNTIKLLGVPNGQGWANESVHLIDAFIAFESESNKMESEEMKKRQDELKRKSGKGKKK